MGHLLPDPDMLGPDFIFPLTFLAILLPLLRHRTDLLAAAAAGMIALGMSRVSAGGVTVLVSTIAAASLGAVLQLRRERAA